MLKQVTNFLEQAGMWMPENKPKYDFRISPSVFPIDQNQIDQLENFIPQLVQFFEAGTGLFPAFCKVDVMINKNGDLKIAEIDGLNKRAFGYAILERKIAKMFGHSSNFFPGVEHSLKSIIGNKKFFVIVPGKEKYYKYGFDFLINELKEIGVDAAWGHEKAALSFLQNNNPEEVVLLDAPFTNHENLDYLLKNKNWNVLIPNNSLFSTKSNLVDFSDPIIPKTVNLDPNYNLPFDRYVIKHVGRSGCKGVFFNDEEVIIDQGQYVAQEYVEGKEFEFMYFDGDTLVESAGWQTRLIVTLDLVNQAVVDVDVTARQDRLVHGAPDSIQIAGVRK